MGKTMEETMRMWLNEHPDATPYDAFKAGWFACTDTWCHGKREKMELVCEAMKEILE